MRIPVDVTNVRFVVAEMPEPSIEFETKAPRVDDAGQPIFQVALLAVGAGTREMLVVKVSPEPKGLTELAQVKVADLVATTWTIGDRSGVSFKASKIEPLGSRSTQA